MRIAIAQINPTLGDFQKNAEKILDYILRARDKECSLVIFPECTLFGYHPFDLLERKELVQQQEKSLQWLQKNLPKDIGVFVGAIRRNTAKKGRPYFNSALFLEKGKKAKEFHKQLLPTGDVFDEARFIQSGTLKNNFLEFKGKKFFVTICEDIWAWPDKKNQSAYETNPLQSVKKSKVDMVINLSASPFFPGKLKKREYVTQKTAAHFKAPIMYVNMVGAQDEIIFDGASFVQSPQGKILLRCQQFEEDLNVFNLETRQAWAQADLPKGAELVRRALVLGIRDFCDKTGLQKLHLGLSGGIDSAVVACLAVDALGASRVTGLGMPGPFSAPESLDLAEKLAKNLGIKFIKSEIKGSYETVLKSFEEPLELKEFGIVQENIQARLRGLTLMAYSNKENSLLLTTGNKSEYAAGYSTLYGDMCGGLAPIGDLTKEQVYALAELYNDQSELIPRAIVNRPPTAELRPNQKDQDTLPPYDKLDRAVVNLVENSGPMKTETDKWLLPVLLRTEFKRWQAAPILKMSEHSFGRGRRFPIAHKAKIR